MFRSFCTGSVSVGVNVSGNRSPSEPPLVVVKPLNPQGVVTPPTSNLLVPGCRGGAHRGHPTLAEPGHCNLRRVVAWDFQMTDNPMFCRDPVFLVKAWLSESKFYACEPAHFL